MGKIQKGTLGEFTGKIGNLVGCNWKGVPYMRSRPTHMTNPRTKEQQHQRGKFTIAMDFLRTITPFVRIGYRELATNQTAFNAAMSYIMKNAIIDNGQGLELDYNKVLVSHGSLMQVFQATAILEASNVLFTWENNGGQGNATNTDVALLLVYNKEKNLAIYNTTAFRRSDSKSVLELPKDWTGDEMVAYLSFCIIYDESTANSICLPLTAS